MRRTFSHDFKNMIIKLHLEENIKIKDLSDSYGISEGTISRWIIKYRNQNKIGKGALVEGVEDRING